mmetsp:Transcript_3703/g.11054  ORF Transcript_3703/g.11054 Transcript_3703/m.11054 type:complete len:584 (+) Transcript_3703:80-1831(+)
MSRRVAREAARLAAAAPRGECTEELTALALACAKAPDRGETAETFARAGGLVALAAAVTACLNGDRGVRPGQKIGDFEFEDDVQALLSAGAQLLRRCRKDVLKAAVESPLVAALSLSVERSNPSIGVVTAVADSVGTLAAACDYNALRGVELGLLDGVLRAARQFGPRTQAVPSSPEAGLARQDADRKVQALDESKQGVSGSVAGTPPPPSPTEKMIANLDRAVLRALTGSGLDVPRLPRGGRRGVRILALDGGGTRALTALEMVREIELQTKRPIHQIFDLIGGTSTGGILALALGIRMRSVNDCEKVYKTMAAQIFSRGTRVLSAGRLLLLNKGQYNTSALEAVLKDALGDSTLVDSRINDARCPRVFVVSTMMSTPAAVPYLHANYRPPPRPPGSGEHRYRHGAHHMLWEAARASTAVPSYFDAYKSGGELFCDGAILVNNPAAIAVHEARLLWPNAPLDCVVSVGTGKSDFSTRVSSENLYGIAKALINSATDTEAVHHALEDLAPSGAYFRFNPVIPQDVALDEARPQKLDEIQKLAREYVQNHRDRFQELANLIVDGRETTQRDSTKSRWPRWTTRL